MAASGSILMPPKCIRSGNSSSMKVITTTRVKYMPPATPTRFAKACERGLGLLSPITLQSFSLYLACRIRSRMEMIIKNNTIIAKIMPFNIGLTPLLSYWGQAGNMIKKKQQDACC
jgi:hypothetical protein